MMPVHSCVPSYCYYDNLFVDCGRSFQLVVACDDSFSLSRVAGRFVGLLHCVGSELSGVRFGGGFTSRSSCSDQHLIHSMTPNPGKPKSRRLLFTHVRTTVLQRVSPLRQNTGLTDSSQYNEPVRRQFVGTPTQTSKRMIIE